jgi:RNase adaptor protein for sRNA GlmZ degradation
MSQATSTGSDQVELLSKLQDQLMFLSNFEADLLSRFNRSKKPIPLEIGEVLEDIANEYLNMSDLISARYLKAHRATLSSRKGKGLGRRVEG